MQDQTHVSDQIALDESLMPEAQAAGQATSQYTEQTSEQASLQNNQAAEVLDLPQPLSKLAQHPQPTRRYTVGEEIANAVSHGIGCGLGVAALVLLIVMAVRHGSGARLAGALFMGIPLIIEYLFSTLYHAIQAPRAKAVLRVFDHACIYLLIAGSYAPFALVTLRERGGLALFVVVCTFAVAGIIAESILRERQPAWLDAVIFLIMGWIVVFRITDVIELLPTPAFRLLLAGGLSYSAGAAFYVMRRTRYMHFVFHLFTLAGSTCITLAALLFVV